MKLLDGNKIAQRNLQELADSIAASDIQPALAVILVGGDPASHLYVSLKEKAAKKIGVEVRRYLFDAHVSHDELATCIAFLNEDTDTHGMIVQLPLPTHLDANAVVNLIDPHKDVDGFHEKNQEKFIDGTDFVYPVFPQAIMELVCEGGEHIAGKKAVVVGKSDVFDHVMTHALERSGLCATFVQLLTSDQKLNAGDYKKIKNADVVISAVGRQRFLKGNFFRDDAIVIDGGIAKVDEKTVGDVDQDSCKDTNITLSPVPGGVGPLTVAYLLENLFIFAQKSQKKAPL